MDESGLPIFIIKQDELQGTEFWPYNLGTIHEYIKAKQELNEDKLNESGAV